ncbi:hypothetical protein HY640_00585 [Candidatus Woesearchaeota archaeon]|nr:hypothetical protein [Candidatus Woesearchaeota archaeon]
MANTTPPSNLEKRLMREFESRPDAFISAAGKFTFIERFVKNPAFYLICLVLGRRGSYGEFIEAQVEHKINESVFYSVCNNFEVSPLSKPDFETEKRQQYATLGRIHANYLHEFEAEELTRPPVGDPLFTVPLYLDFRNHLTFLVPQAIQMGADAVVEYRVTIEQKIVALQHQITCDRSLPNMCGTYRKITGLAIKLAT